MSYKYKGIALFQNSVARGCETALTHAGQSIQAAGLTDAHKCNFKNYFNETTAHKFPYYSFHSRVQYFVTDDSHKWLMLSMFARQSHEISSETSLKDIAG